MPLHPNTEKTYEYIQKILAIAELHTAINLKIPDCFRQFYCLILLSFVKLLRIVYVCMYSSIYLYSTYTKCVVCTSRANTATESLYAITSRPRVDIKRFKNSNDRRCYFSLPNFSGWGKRTGAFQEPCIFFHVSVLIKPRNLIPDLKRLEETCSRGCSMLCTSPQNLRLGASQIRD